MRHARAMATGERLRFLSTGTVLAVLVTTSISTVPVVLVQRDLLLPLSLLAAAMVTWAIAGLWVLDFKEPRPPSWAPEAMVLGYAALAVSSLWLSKGATFVVVMPVVSISVLYLSLSRAVMLSIALAVLTTASATSSAYEAALHLSGTIASMVFVVVFSLIARRERSARNELERLSAQVAELATEKERSRLARELHDSLGHALTVAHVQLEAARSDPDTREARIVQAQTLLAEGLRELRRTVSKLRDQRAPVALHAALTELATDSQTTGLSTEVVMKGTPRQLSADLGFALFRAAQEGLTNVHRHARATRVVLALTYAENGVTLEVIDDGASSNGTVTRGNGLRGLEERVTTLGGTLRTTSNGGFTLSVEVPT